MNDANPPERINLLAKKWQDGTITHIEKQEFENWYTSFENTFEMDSDETKEEAEHRLYSLITKKGNIGAKHRSRWPRIAAAASILLCLGIGGYYFASNSRTEFAQTPLIVNDVAPGGSKAVLTLGNGEQIVLSDAKNGQLATQGSTQIIKTADGHIAYSASTRQASALLATSYNTISTPLGGEYHLILADGTNVWLNAASSIKYPTQFTGTERKVEITGEVYFEVAHNAAMPFRVKSNQQLVEVLGTHFNINSYADENSTKTTLLEGSVKVITANSFKIIKPSQQAILNGDQLAVNNANTEEVVAWKNGYFRFNDEKIGSVMRKISRWYNIDVDFKGNTLTEGFNGKISRYKNISQVLKMLEKTKAAHFKVEGRVVTVMQ